VLNWKARGVLLRLPRIEGDAIEQSFRIVVWSAMLVTNLLHRLLVNIWPHDLLGHSGIIRRAAYHPPAAKLREPPNGVLRLGIVAVALVIDHVIVILLCAAVAEVIVSQQPAQDDFLGTIDI